MCHINSLKLRFFQGTVYRGVMTTEKCLRSYQSIRKNRSCIITNNTFWSTSLDRNVAQMYFNNEENAEQINILFIIGFSRQTEMAIRLSAIEEHRLKTLSIFEDEEEVLILPGAIFRLVEIENNHYNPRLYTIRLENIFIPPFSRLRLIRKSPGMMYQIIRERFDEYRIENKQSQQTD